MSIELSSVDSEEEERKYYGVVSGQVVNLADPLLMGRVQVRISAFDPLDLQAWARLVLPMAGLLHGTYFVPSIGDEVLLAFENGDLHAPYVLGSLHNAVHPAPVPTPLAEIRTIRTPLGNQLVFSELTQSVVLQSAPTPPAVVPAPPVPTAAYSSVALSPEGTVVASPGPITLTSATAVVLQVGPNTLTVSAAGIEINGELVDITASGSAGVTAPVVRINS